MWLFQTISKSSLTLLLAHFLHLGSTDGKYSSVWDVLAKDRQLDACSGESIAQHTYQLWATVSFSKEDGEPQNILSERCSRIRKCFSSVSAAT